MAAGWNMRQAEVDALKTEVSLMHAALLHRCVVTLIDPTCKDCKVIIAALDKAQPL